MSRQERPNNLNHIRLLQELAASPGESVRQKEARALIAAMDKVIKGGADTERIFLGDAQVMVKSVSHPDVDITLYIQESDFPGADMDNVFARHAARYALATLYISPMIESGGDRKVRVLDFPCGSGYGVRTLNQLPGAGGNIQYEGRDRDKAAIAYAQQQYSDDDTTYTLGDLTDPQIEAESQDAILCLEGLEHIGMEHQDNLIASFEQGLRPGGVLVVSSPENPAGISGPSEHNKDHLGELTEADFRALILRHFSEENVQFVSQTATLSTGVTTTCWYAICHKPA